MEGSSSLAGRLNRSHRLRRNNNQASSDLEELEMENEDLVAQNKMLRKTLEKLLICSKGFSHSLDEHVKHANNLLATSILDTFEEPKSPREVKRLHKPKLSPNTNSVPILRKSMSVSDRKTFSASKTSRKARSTSGEFPKHSLRHKSSASDIEPLPTQPVEITPQREDSDEFSQFIISPKRTTNDSPHSQVSNAKTRRSHSSASIMKVGIDFGTNNEQSEMSPTCKKRLKTTKRRSLSNKSSGRASLKVLKEDSVTEWTSTMHGKDAVVIRFDPEQETDFYNLVAFVDTFRNSMPDKAPIECYEGDCIFKKHGEGSFYTQNASEPSCGLWINDELVESHHEFILPDKLQQHLNEYHSNGSIAQQKEIEHKQSLMDKMLPEEIIALIFGFLDIRSLCMVGLVSRKWNRVANGSVIWCLQHLRKWGLFETNNQQAIDVTLSDDNLCWKDIVRDKYRLESNWRNGNCHASVLHGHSGWVTCVDVHHNRLVSSSYDGTVRVWNTQTGNSLQTFGPTEGLSPTWCTQFKANSIFAGYSDSIVRQWNTNTGQEVLQFHGHLGGVKSLLYDESENTLTTGSDDKTVKIFDVRTGEIVRSISCSDSVGNIQAHNNMLLTVIKRESNIYWYDLRTGELVRELEGHSKAVYSLQFHPDSNRLATGSRDRDVLLWNMESGECIKKFSGHEFTVMSVHLDARKLISASGDQSIKVWDIKSGRCVSTLLKHTEVIMSIKSDDNKIVSGAADKTVIVWDFLRPTKH